MVEQLTCNQQVVGSIPIVGSKTYIKMAKISNKAIKKTKTYKRTSIGKSRWSRPKNKNKRGNWKRYRGQGR